MLNIVYMHLLYHLLFSQLFCPAPTVSGQGAELLEELTYLKRLDLKGNIIYNTKEKIKETY